MIRIKAHHLQPRFERRCDLLGCNHIAVIGVGRGSSARAYCKRHTEIFAAALQRLDAEQERRRKLLSNFNPEAHDPEAQE